MLVKYKKRTVPPVILFYFNQFDSYRDYEKMSMIRISVVNTICYAQKKKLLVAESKRIATVLKLYVEYQTKSKSGKGGIKDTFGVIHMKRDIHVYSG